MSFGDDPASVTNMCILERDLIEKRQDVGREVWLCLATNSVLTDGVRSTYKK